MTMAIDFGKYAHLSDKGTGNSYIPFYEKTLANLVGTPAVLLEVGVLGGGSMMMWSDFLGPKSRIFGLDVSPPIRIDRPNVTVLQGNSTQRGPWLDLIPPCDVIVDDGSHELEDQKATWQTLWPLLKPSGIYVIEDVQSDIGISELLRMIPDSNVENMRHVKDRWDDVLVWTVKQ